mmetsp:Transcript_15189/g.29155  ORF Transcript_15189/g.29155 Transcript_15189/m.29155 type:complete len:201 (-) Transcript_15189:1204-1806(-)
MQPGGFGLVAIIHPLRSPMQAQNVALEGFGMASEHRRAGEKELAHHGGSLSTVLPVALEPVPSNGGALLGGEGGARHALARLSTSLSAAPCAARQPAGAALPPQHVPGQQRRVKRVGVAHEVHALAPRERGQLVLLVVHHQHLHGRVERGAGGAGCTARSGVNGTQLSPVSHRPRRRGLVLVLASPFAVSHAWSAPRCKL